MMDAPGVVVTLTDCIAPGCTCACKFTLIGMIDGDAFPCAPDTAPCAGDTCARAASAIATIRETPDRDDLRMLSPYLSA